MNLSAYWRAVLRQDAEAMRPFFAPGAVIRWPNTGEQFTAEAFIRVNCAYPGEWRGRLERVERMGDVTVCAAHVHSPDGSASFHVVSFMRLAGGKIAELVEYWGDDGPPPAWRREMAVESAGCDDTVRPDASEL